MDNMTQKVIGVVGGAGPMAGLLLAKKVIEICQKDYQCVRDADFPKLILLNEPFAEMLQPNSEKQNDAMISRQLQGAIQFLLRGGASNIAIACNTLHGFLDGVYEDKLVNLIKETECFIARKKFTNVLVLATSTSASKHLYNFEAAQWPSKRLQEALDRLIDSVLSGGVTLATRKRLETIIQRSINLNRPIDAILLGCTELSLLMDGVFMDFFGGCIIDPVKIAAKVLCTHVFHKP